MKILFFFTFLLTINFVQGQTTDDSEEMQFVIGDEIVYGAHIDINPIIITKNVLEFVFEPIRFRKNWPLYGYALPWNGKNYLCNINNENYLNLPIGRAMIALSKIYDSTKSTKSYIGSSMRSIDHSDGYIGFSTRDFCRWLTRPDQFKPIILKLDAIPLDLPNGEWHPLDLSSNEEIEHNPKSLLIPLMKGEITNRGDTQSASILTWRNEHRTNQTIAWKWGDSLDRNIDNLWKYTPTEHDDQSILKVHYYFSLVPPFDGVEYTSLLDITWSSPSPSGTKRWKWKDVPGNLTGSRISMWYVPKNSQNSRPLSSYILAEQPLPTFPIDVRVATHSSPAIWQSSIND